MKKTLSPLYYAFWESVNTSNIITIDTPYRTIIDKYISEIVADKYNMYFLGLTEAEYTQVTVNVYKALKRLYKWDINTCYNGMVYSKTQRAYMSVHCVNNNGYQSDKKAASSTYSEKSKHGGLKMGHDKRYKNDYSQTVQAWCKYHNQRMQSLGMTVKEYAISMISKDDTVKLALRVGGILPHYDSKLALLCAALTGMSGRITYGSLKRLANKGNVQAAEKMQTWQSLVCEFADLDSATWVQIASHSDGLKAHDDGNVTMDDTATKAVISATQRELYQQGTKHYKRQYVATVDANGTETYFADKLTDNGAIDMINYSRRNEALNNFFCYIVTQSTRPSARWHDILILRADGYKVAEIAERLGMSARAVNNALETMRDYYKGYITEYCQTGQADIMHKAEAALTPTLEKLFGKSWAKKMADGADDTLCDYAERLNYKPYHKPTHSHDDGGCIVYSTRTLTKAQAAAEDAARVHQADGYIYIK